jgi:catechol 2,3-dioxygenase-like lactoylglutathione lyase family enzyme
VTGICKRADGALASVAAMSETTPVASAATATIAMVTIDCADATELATFYSQLLGMTIAYQDDNVAMITGESGPALGFGKVDHYTAPPWPDEKSEKQFHLDLKVADIAGAEAACVRLGATRPEHQPGGDRWRVMLDPAGHPFCLALWQG